MKLRTILTACLVLATPSFGQSFSCRIGQDAACLDYGEKVCRNGGKCVEESAECFAAYQCDFKGFACKSDVVECAEAHDKLLDEYNALSADYDTMFKAGKELAEALDELNKAYDDAETCLALASTLEAAKVCMN